MKPTFRAPSKGDIIRTKVTFYYHYGIYESDERIIQFGLPDNVNRTADEVRVVESDISTFLMLGGELEVMEPERQDRRRLRSPEDVVRAAEARLGEGGYDAFSNNCLTFAEQCKFKDK